MRPKRITRKPARLRDSTPPITSIANVSELPEIERPSNAPLKAIAVEPIPKSIANALPSKAREIPPYDPPLGRILWQAGQAIKKAIDAFSVFTSLFSIECVDKIVTTTNFYAENYLNSFTTYKLT